MEHLPKLYTNWQPPAKQEEESTSVYELKRDAMSLITRQLRFFASPVNRQRTYEFVLKTGEIVVGTIEKIENDEVLVRTFQQKLWISENAIRTIQVK